MTIQPSTGHVVRIFVRTCPLDGADNNGALKGPCCPTSRCPAGNEQKGPTKLGKGEARPAAVPRGTARGYQRPPGRADVSSGLAPFDGHRSTCLSSSARCDMRVPVTRPNFDRPCELRCPICGAPRLASGLFACNTLMRAAIEGPPAAASTTTTVTTKTYTRKQHRKLVRGDRR
jgi:hypothetical protein